jgi:hypothetical protein
MRRQILKQILIEKYIKPSEIFKLDYDDGFKIERWFDRYGDLHSFMGHPAEVVFCKFKLSEKRWFKKGILHSDGQFPSIIEYQNKQKETHYWFKRGVLIKKENFYNI